MLQENAFKINYYTLAIQLMPVKWRKPIHMAYVKVLVTPFVMILQQLRRFRTASIYKLQHDSRIGKIEKVINDIFDIVEGRIFIVEGQRKNQTYSYFREENKEPLVSPFTTYFPKEVSAFSADFEVHIPSQVGLITSDLTRLNTLVRYYADKDKHFIVKIV